MKVEYLIVEFFQKVPVKSTKNNDSIFVLWPKSTLTGGAYPCKYLYCRMSRLEELMRFTSLYALHCQLDFRYL